MAHGRDREARRAEYLDAACDLFAERGYEATTVQAIIDRMGASKGAFYHYFAAKEDVLEGVALREVGKLVRSVEELAADPASDAMPKLNLCLAAVLRFSSAGQSRLPLASALANPANILLTYRVRENVAQRGLAIFGSIVAQGLREGAFDTAYPDEAAEMVMRVAFRLNDALTLALLGASGGPPLGPAGRTAPDRESLQRTLLFYQDALERLLGARTGSVRLEALGAPAAGSPGAGPGRGGDQR